jgi:hypothetical protein
VSLTLEAVAEQVIWWKPPAEALADRRYFLARVMAAGTFDEVRCVRGQFPPEAFRAVLDDPPPGVRSALVGLLEPRVRPRTSGASPEASVRLANLPSDVS